ncbi:MAG TPA: ParB/RepB/Spo0J family partition protein [Candidatus Acidoferrales bacterium]|nr:ParB/RepB/Spo0J family partition protein [Candidatus Acidoferrales bacterium]
MPRNALGRGLGALIRENDPRAAAAPPGPATGASSSPGGTNPDMTSSGPGRTPIPTGAHTVDIDLIDPSPFQPRTKFREEALAELARSIELSGIIQPLIVRPVAGRFQLIAGERRWRAAQRAGLQGVPVVFRDVSDQEALEMTLIENIQREDLNAIEEARAFERLMKDFNLTQEQVADRTGKDRTTVANSLRLLRLESKLQDMIEDGRLTASHGRALLMVPDLYLRLKLANRAAKGLTVRQIEKMMTKQLRISGAGGGMIKPIELDANTKAALEELQRYLGTRVYLRPKSGTRPGQLILEYYEEAQLTEIYDRLMR